MKVSKVYNCIAYCLVSEKMKATWSNSTWSIVGEVRMGWEGDPVAWVGPLFLDRLIDL